MELSQKAEELWKALRELNDAIRRQNRESHGRLNPLTEDLFEWKERGAYWVGSDRDVTIYNSTTLVGDVKIGSHTWVGPFCSLDGTGGLEIGHHCSVSAGCQLQSHDSVRWALSGGRAEYEHAPIKIGDCCFLGVHSVVTKGVTIGDHCLVAAGAVVTKDVPDNTIVAGIPARPIGAVEIRADGSVNLTFN